MADVIHTRNGTETDLGDYKVKIARGALGWSWEVETPDGETLSDIMSSMARERAEDDALKAIEAHANQAPTIDGNQLRNRVRDR